MSRISRRSVLGAGVTSLVLAGRVDAQQSSWPQRPVTFLSPFAPGGGVDVATRMLVDKLQVVWNGIGGIVDNRTGGNTIIATNALLAAPRDGYTFLVTIGLTLQLPALMDKVPFNPATDLVPVGAITTEQLILVTSARSGVKNAQELFAAIKSRPRDFAFGSFGIGSVSHLLQAQINRTLNVDTVHVPYRGAAPAVQSLLSGDVGLVLSNSGSVRQHLASGKLVGIAVNGAHRNKVYPDLPTFEELGIKGFDLPSWIGVFAARGISPAIVRKLSEDMKSALQTPDLMKKILEFGQEPGHMTTEEFAAMVRRDDENSTRLIRAYGIKLD